MKHCALLIVVFLSLLLLFSCKKDGTDDTPEYIDKPIDEICEMVDNVYSDLESFLIDKFKSDYSDKAVVLSAVKEWLNSEELVSKVENESDTCIVITFVNGLQTNVTFGTSDNSYEVDEDSFKADSLLQNVPGLMEGVAHETNIAFATKEITRAGFSTRYPFQYLYVRYWEPFRESGLTDRLAVESLKKYKKVVPMAQDTYYDGMCTLATLCNIGNPNSKGLYPNVIMISTHGAGGKIIQTVYNPNDFETLVSWDKYKNVRGRRVVDIIVDKRRIEKRINIPYDYLQENLQSVNESIVFLNHCESTPISELGISSAFQKKGNASVVFGYQYVVSNAACIENTYRILTYMLSTPRRREDVHSAFFAYHFNITPAEQENMKIWGNTGNNVRFLPKVYTKSIRTRGMTGMGALHLDYCDPTAGYDKVVCGLVYATDEESLYLDSDEKAGFVSAEVDHFVENGEDFFFSMEDLKPNTSYYYRAFLAVRYPEGILIHYADDVCTFETEAEELIDIPDSEFKRYLTTAHRYRFTGSSEEYMSNGTLWEETDVLIDADGDGEISVSEADSIKYIHLSLVDYDVHSLRGIERMPNLAYFIFRRLEYGSEHTIEDAIESVDLSGNQSLRFLDCSNSGLKSLDVSSCAELREIDCRDNYYLERLEVRGASGLESLYCVNCPNLASLGVSGMPNLRKLTCSRCNIQTLDLSDCKKLDVARAVSSALNYGANPVSYLNVSGAGIDDQGEEGKRIWISDPCANTLAIEGGASLNEVHVGGGDEGKTVSLYFPDSPGLSDITCSLPTIKDINVSGAGVDVELNVISASELKIVGGSSLKRFICYSYDCPNLTRLDVSECPALENLGCGGLVNLQELDISGCNMLKRLSCYELNLHSLDLRHCKSLIQLYAPNCLSMETIKLPYWISNISYRQWGEWHHSYYDNNKDYGTYNPMIYVDGKLVTYEYRSSHQDVGSTYPPDLTDLW